MGSMLDRMLAEEEQQKPSSMLDTMLAGGTTNTSIPAAPKPDNALDPANLRQVALDNVQAPDPLWKQGALATVQAGLNLPSGVARTLGHVIPGLTQVADHIDQFSAAITPTQSGANPNAEAAIQTLGTVLGESAANIVGFEGTKAVVGVIGAGLKRAAPELAASALSTVAKAGRTTELAAKQFIDASDAARLGNAVIALPSNVAAGLGMQALVDPSSLSTPTGLAKGLGFSMLGALMEGKGNDRSIARRPKTIDPDLPLANQAAQNVIQQHADVNVPDLREKAQQARTRVVDRFNPVKIFSEVVLGDRSLHDATQLLVNGSNSRISEMIQRGTKSGAFGDLTNQTAGMTEIMSTLSPKEAAVGGHLDQLLLARRVLDEGVQTKIAEHVKNGGLETEIVPLSTANARQIVANAPQHIVDAADGMVGYMNAVKEYGIRSGALHQDVIDAYDASNPDFIPLKREVDKIMDPTLRPIDNTFGAGKILQRMFGSEKDVLSPTNNIRDFTATVMRTSDRNAIGQLILDATESNPFGAEAMGVERLTGADMYNNPRFYEAALKMQDALAAEGVQISTGLSHQLTSQFGKLFDPEGNILSVQTPDGIQRVKLNPELAKMYQSLAPKELGFIMKMLAIPTRALRTGITASLDFSGVNLIRDSFDATLQGQYGWKWGDDFSKLPVSLAKGFQNTGKGLVSALKKDQNYSDFRGAGGDFGDVSRLGSVNPNNVFEGIRPTTLGQKIGNVVLHPIDALKEVARPFEEAARIGEFISNREHGASLQESALAGRRVTTDFQQVGLSMQGLSQIIAFMNPGIQSMDRNAQVFMSNKAGLAAKGLASISIPTIALWAANRNDQGIQDLRKTPAGSTYWFVRAGDHIVRIPKPFLYGQVFGTSMETALDKAFDKDPEAVDRFVRSVFDQASINVVPNAFAIPYQIKMNKDIYTGGNIIPDALKGMDPQVQVTLGTSQLAQHISKTLYDVSAGGINVSPIQLDWVAKNTGGNVARDILSLNGEKSSIADYPFFRRFFVNYPSMSVEPIQTFYDKADKFNGVVHTVDRMTKSGATPEALNKYLTAHSNEFAYASVYAEAQKQMKEFQKTIWQIHTAPEQAFTKEQRKEYIQQMTTAAIELARGINSSVQATQNKY